MDAYVEDQVDRRENSYSRSVSDNRITTIHVVAEAWEEFCRDKKKLVKYVHQHYY